MKTKLPLLAVLLFGFSCQTSPLQAADDLHVIYEEGRAAFNAGQLELAREKLAIVKSRNPNHVPTLAMLSQIEQKLGMDNTMLRKSYETVIIDKIEFTEVELSEALQAVRILSKKASKEKIIPNIILKNPELGKKTVSINLTNVPLSEVLSYLAQLTGAKLTYDKIGVMFSSIAG
jgi:hypothetical protein